MFKFGVENLRRLKKVDLVDLRPITVLVGRNSAGKSTFLRAFALLRQSISTRISSPILWYGDIVDFGSFKGCVYNNDTDQEISFTFGLDYARLQPRPYYNPYSGLYVMRYDSTVFNDINLRVSVGAFQETSRLTSFSISVGSINTIFYLQVAKDGHVNRFEINGRDALGYFSELKIVVPPGSLFPETIFVANEKADINTTHRLPEELRQPVRLLAAMVAPLLDKRLKSEAVEEIALGLLNVKSIDKKTMAEHASRSSVRSWEKLLSNIADKDKHNLFTRIEHLYRATQLRGLLSEVSNSLKSILSQTLYIGPARARSERYYRYQDLSVSEIDADGKNFPMFLNSLSKSQQTSLSDWVEKLFNYRIVLEPSGGHISINLVEGGSVTNIVDTGYGVSQILPVLGQIWWSINRNRRNPRVTRRSEVSMLSIEQPELHLHPAHQAMLADALATESGSVVRQSSDQSRPHFLIETHSEAFVNRLGELIAQGLLKADNVQILVFAADPEDDRSTVVSEATFSQNGELANWPYGFFLPAES